VPDGERHVGRGVGPDHVCQVPVSERERREEGGLDLHRAGRGGAGRGGSVSCEASRSVRVARPMWTAICVQQ
jgi:hypothetical protein